MSRPIRVRFAPSPTGPLHIGGVRTALYNYLFAKKNKGIFILRIEDTDQTRFVEGATNYILESLQWCGITPDEGPGIGGQHGPYVQSERKDIYKQYIQELLEKGHAYYAFDTPEELEQKRSNEKENGNANWQYDASTRMSMRNSLTLSEQETQELIQSGAAYTIRTKIEPNQTIVFQDLIRGTVRVNSDVLDDKVLFKSDGLPTYHFANIIDDHLMEISHVIRGEEWLPSTALHTLLYSFFGWEAPLFSHLPLILKPDGKGKLSKRDGDKMGFPVFPLNWHNADGEIYTGFREQGYLPEAFINMLALLGWNSGTEQEIFTLEELIQAFSLEKVNKSGARFDPEKTKWFQQQHLKNKDNSEILKLIQSELPENKYSEENLKAICGLMKERVVFAKEIVSESAYFFSEPNQYDEKTVEKKWKDNSPALLEELAADFNQLNAFEATNIESCFQEFIAKKEIGLGQLMPVLRLALTGLGNGPQIFEIAALLGKTVVIERIEKAISSITKA
jgi:glutamyl-tRNA synthetase